MNWIASLSKFPSESFRFTTGKTKIASRAAWMDAVLDAKLYAGNLAALLTGEIEP
jgi:hypothetical protein